MRAVIQRVREASVEVNGEELGRIGQGVVILLGVAKGDTLRDVNYLVEKAANLRIFEDREGRFNHSIMDKKGDALVVSQFTLLGETAKGRRPGFDDAAHPEAALELYKGFIQLLREKGLKVETGLFGAKMLVRICNDGPATFILESRR